MIYEENTPVEGEFKEHALSALNKFKTFHEDIRKNMTEEEKIIDSRTFNYFFFEDEEVMLDTKLTLPIEYGMENINLNNYVGKKCIVKRCHSDIHGFGQGYAYLMDVEIDGVLIKDLMPAYFIKYTIQK